LRFEQSIERITPKAVILTTNGRKNPSNVGASISLGFFLFTLFRVRMTL
jgi:hypothetical protein